MNCMYSRCTLNICQLNLFFVERQFSGTPTVEGRKGQVVSVIGAVVDVSSIKASQRSSMPSPSSVGSPSSSLRWPSTLERTPSGPLPWMVPRVMSGESYYPISIMAGIQCKIFSGVMLLRMRASPSPSLSARRPLAASST